MLASEKFEMFLENSKDDTILCRYSYLLGEKDVLSFAVIYFTVFGGKRFEVIRYDGQRDEKVNVHKFYSGSEEKVYLNNELSFESVFGFVKDIEKNWHRYKILFIQNNYI